MDNKEQCIDYVISLSVVASLFITSEILPFLSGTNNGLAQCLVKLFEGSECILSKLISCLKKEKDGTEVNTSVKQEVQQNINISIGEKTNEA